MTIDRSYSEQPGIRWRAYLPPGRRDAAWPASTWPAPEPTFGDGVRSRRCHPARFRSQWAPPCLSDRAGAANAAPGRMPVSASRLPHPSRMLAPLMLVPGVTSHRGQCRRRRVPGAGEVRGVADPGCGLRLLGCPPVSGARRRRLRRPGRVDRLFVRPLPCTPRAAFRPYGCVDLGDAIRAARNGRGSPGQPAGQGVDGAFEGGADAGAQAASLARSSNLISTSSSAESRRRRRSGAGMEGKAPVMMNASRVPVLARPG